MKSALCLTLMLVACRAAGAPADDTSAMPFDPSVVRTVHLKLSPEQWKAIEPTTSRPGGGFMRRMEYPVVHAAVEFAGKTYDDVALRYKGT